MGKINVLSFEIANLIAAGEVVERPASVLKELIENSIDSGADEITAEIKHGGVSLIRVSDNGCGIEKEDLPVSLKRHATSKIKERSDLDSIMTLGFRGEALSAISSVSMMTIISKTKDAEEGTMLTAEGGKVIDISEVGCADGTTVVVENLFYNVPARRKFLKKDSTEAMNVSALVERVALSRPDISIRLLIDGEEKFKTPGKGDLHAAVYAIYGKDFASKLIKADGTANGIHVHGFIGRSDNVRKNRNLLNVFINGRYVKSLTAMAAIEKAYVSYIAPECFPSCVLFLDMNPSAVDVNVHPAKLEVKFSDERAVFEAVYYTVKTALEEHEYRPELNLGAKKPKQNFVGAFIPVGEERKVEQISFSADRRQLFSNDKKITDTAAYSPISKAENAINRSYKDEKKDIYAIKDKAISFGSGIGGFNGCSGPEMTPKDSVELLRRYKDAVPNAKDVSADENKTEKTATFVPLEPVGETPEYKIIGEAFNCYVMVEFEDSILIIDKHAAHERVIFEDLKKKLRSDGHVASQSLMLPITVILTGDELSAAIDNMDEFKALGFDFSVNERACDLFAIPTSISPEQAENLFTEMTDEIVSGQGNPTVTEAARQERSLYQIACKAAIKGGRVYDRTVIEWLVSKLLSLPDITVCPHGRPVAYKLTKNELDRQFDRIK